MITDEIKNFVEVKIGKLIAYGGYKPMGFSWSLDWCGVQLGGFKGHPSVFHGIFKEIERAVKKRFNRRITIYTKSVPLLKTKESRSNSWYWYGDVWAKGQKRCWGCS